MSVAVCRPAVCGTVVVWGLLGLPAYAQTTPHAGMLKFPDVSATQIVFSYANDLWVVPREGGLATPLASPPGLETFPRFGPDGRTIAFVGNYDGNSDLYTIPVAGGVPQRVTHHPDDEYLTEWTPDGRLLFFSSALAGLRRQTQLYTVAAGGGLPEQLPVPYGANGAISPDGVWLAYTPHTTDNRTWKRYRGGMATDIWLFNLKDQTARRATDWEGTDSQPMWQDDKLYYMSDAGANHRLNIWMWDPKTGRREQVTHYADYDIKWPAIGPGAAGGGEIVYQMGDELHLLDLVTRATRIVEVTIPGDRPTLRPQRVDVREFIQSWDISPTGKRALLQARGDIWTIPARHGSPRNLTRTSGVAEREPTWSPDARWIAYWSDESGENELYLMQADGLGEHRQLTSHGPGFRGGLAWSPDSKYLSYADNAGRLWLCTAETGATELVNMPPWGDRPQVAWSPDSRWLAYTERGDNGLNALWLYKLETEEKSRLTSGMFQDFSPTFDRKGEYLFFASNREWDTPVYGDVGGTWVYLKSGRLYCVPLRADVTNPLAPKSDEEEWKKDEEKKQRQEEGDADKKDAESQPESGPSSAPAAGEAAESKPADTQAASQPASAPDTAPARDEEKPKDKEDDVKPIEIDIADFERRALPLPVEQGYFASLAVNDQGHLLYVRHPGPGGGESAIKIFDIMDEEKKEKTVLGEAGGFVLSADRKKLLALRGDSAAIIDARPDQKLDKLISRDGLVTVIDPRAEWRQIYNDAWRIMRDYFYVANMHNLDWPAMRDHYAGMLADCVCRDDLTHIIKELISELNVGHAYYYGRSESGPQVNVGMLGCDFELHDGAYRIAKMITGAAWDADARGPLSQPGLKVKDGDYLLAVNGVPVDPSKDPWAALQGLADRVVTLTVSEKPQLDEAARQVIVKLVGGEADLRFRAFIEHKRRYVEEKTGGRVGYIYVPDTGRGGQNELFRQFQGQIDKPALIIDERWNGGGQIPDRFIELLNRPLYQYWARRHGKDVQTPGMSHVGPKCMLINGLAGSGGDAFPAYFRKAGLGKLIGMRTWGGLVGMSGNPGLIDGAYMTVPTFGAFDLDGTWTIEGHGVDPDIEVIDDPSRMVDGGDPQLDAGIELMLNELEERPYTPPARPADPDRRGMGIREEDK